MRTPRALRDRRQLQTPYKIGQWVEKGLRPISINAVT